jgi:hypothetical protein
MLLQTLVPFPSENKSCVENKSISWYRITLLELVYREKKSISWYIITVELSSNLVMR